MLKMRLQLVSSSLQMNIVNLAIPLQVIQLYSALPWIVALYSILASYVSSLKTILRLQIEQFIRSPLTLEMQSGRLLSGFAFATRCFDMHIQAYSPIVSFMINK